MLFQGEACDGCVGEDGDALQVMRCPRAEPQQRSGPRPATRGCPGRTHVVVETELHWKPVRSNINLLGAVITAWSA